MTQSQRKNPHTPTSAEISSWLLDSFKKQEVSQRKSSLTTNDIPSPMKAPRVNADTIDLNMYLARQAICYVKKVLPFGSSNREEDESKCDHAVSIDRNRRAMDECGTYLVIDEIREGKHVFRLFSPIDPDRIATIKRVADIHEKFRAGNCSGQAIVAFNFLKRMGIEDLEIVVFMNEDSLNNSHHCILIGNNVICDPWDCNAYPIHDFDRQKEDSKKEQYTTGIRKQAIDHGEKLHPFLFGRPTYCFRLKWYDPVLIIDGKFPELDYSKSTGTGRALDFSLSRSSFLSKLASMNKRSIKDNTNREMMSQSKQIHDEFKKYNR